MRRMNPSQNCRFTVEKIVANRSYKQAVNMAAGRKEEKAVRMDKENCNTGSDDGAGRAEEMQTW